jgi:DNA-binding NtrC family response regulator
MHAHEIGSVASRSLTDCHLTVGNSPASLRLISLAKQLASTTAPILLCGPSGAEFEAVAQFIHQNSSRANTPFVRQRCIHWQEIAEPSAAISNGTLFVEGIEHASLPVQFRLLNELDQAQQSRKNLGDAAASIAPRVIASTSVDLKQLVTNGIFLEDLYWQLSVLTITVPSLREREADIGKIAQSVLQQIVTTERLPFNPGLTDVAVEQLKAYQWPDNYRELYCCLLRATLLATEPELTFQIGSVVSNAHQAQASSGSVLTDSASMARTTAAVPMDFPTLVQTLVQRGIKEADRNHKELHQFVVENVESALIREILKECENVQIKTAARLGINRNTLHKKMKDFGLEPAG